jgi:hypothetical protein
MALRLLNYFFALFEAYPKGSRFEAQVFSRIVAYSLYVRVLKIRSNKKDGAFSISFEALTPYLPN